MAIPAALKEFFGGMLLWVVNSGGIVINPLAEDDGTLRDAPIGSTDGGTTFANIKVEATGEQDVVNHGMASGTVTAHKVESTGEQDIVLHGKDSGGTIDPFLTNAAKELIVDAKLTNKGEYVSPDDMPGTNTTYYTNSNSGFLADVEIEVVNTSGAAATVTVDVVESGGSAAANRRILAAVPVTPDAVGIRLGVYTIGESGTVQGLCSVANACTIHVHVVTLRTT